jgi:thiamine-phosphate pyrophosphorylase
MNKVQFITHQTERYSYAEGVRIALDGGCRWIQLRMKDASTQEITEMADVVKPMCVAYGAVFIIDDHVELVKELHADGVHLGKNDMPVAEARQILGHDFIIGGTANTLVDVESLYNAGADYVGCGPFRFTTTKKNLSPILGVDGYRQIIKGMRMRNIDIPIFAIGGITCQDIPDIMNTGVDGVAVSGVILNADKPAEEMKRMINIINNI